MLSSLVGTVLTNVVGETIKAKLFHEERPILPKKGVLQSKTMWGGVVAAFGPFLMEWAGLNAEEFETLVQAVGVLVVWWGRKTAHRSM